LSASAFIVERKTKPAQQTARPAGSGRLANSWGTALFYVEYLLELAAPFLGFIVR
jgi:hypothetical protein